jgi:hypothetical protein
VHAHQNANNVELSCQAFLGKWQELRTMLRRGQVNL